MKTKFSQKRGQRAVSWEEASEISKELAFIQSYLSAAGNQANLRDLDTHPVSIGECKGLTEDLYQKYMDEPSRRIAQNIKNCIDLLDRFMDKFGEIEDAAYFAKLQDRHELESQMGY